MKPPLKKTDSNAQGIRARVLSALALHDHEASGTPISVSAICRLACVNRASLYEHHRDLVETIVRRRKTTPTSVEPPNDSKCQRRSVQKSRDLEVRNKALLYLCLELQAEVAFLKARDLSQRKARAPSGRKGSKTGVGG